MLDELLTRWTIRGGPAECWPFKMRNTVSSPGGTHRYGQVTVHGKKYRAHRYVAEAAFGPIPDGMYVCHRCDNTLCLNPKHLFIGTPLDNMRDKIRKGRARHARGEASGQATITDAQVAEVRRRAQAGENQRLLGLEFGVSQPLVSMIKNGHTRT
jgi:hypothetical protein